MHSIYLRCDCSACEAVVDRRAVDDFGGTYRKSESRGTFAVGEDRELLAYAESLGWDVSGGTHRCPEHASLDFTMRFPKNSIKGMYVVPDANRHDRRVAEREWRLK
jgi:hypothetical protein